MPHESSRTAKTSSDAPFDPDEMPTTPFIRAHGWGSKASASRPPPLPTLPAPPNDEENEQEKPQPKSKSKDAPLYVAKGTPIIIMPSGLPPPLPRRGR